MFPSGSLKRVKRQLLALYSCQHKLELGRELSLKTSERKKNRLTSGLPSIPENSNQSWNWADPAGPNFSDLHTSEPTAIAGAYGRGECRSSRVTIFTENTITPKLQDRERLRLKKRLIVFDSGRIAMCAS